MPIFSTTRGLFAQQTSWHMSCRVFLQTEWVLRHEMQSLPADRVSSVSGSRQSEFCVCQPTEWIRWLASCRVCWLTKWVVWLTSSRVCQLTQWGLSRELQSLLAERVSSWHTSCRVCQLTQWVLWLTSCTVCRLIQFCDSRGRVCQTIQYCDTRAAGSACQYSSVLHELHSLSADKVSSVTHELQSLTAATLSTARDFEHFTFVCHLTPKASNRHV